MELGNNNILIKGKQQDNIKRTKKIFFLPKQLYLINVLLLLYINNTNMGFIQGIHVNS